MRHQRPARANSNRGRDAAWRSLLQGWVRRIASIAAAPEGEAVRRFGDCTRSRPKPGSLGPTWRSILETLLYRPVKAFLERLGFVVKGEIGGCDLLALRGGDPPIVVIGELQLAFNLELVLQGVDRAAACDEVWLAARRREGRYLLRSNLTESGPALLWQYYIQLVAVEEAFKNLKGDLAIRPIFHHSERRIEAHIFVAFLAYCLQITLTRRLHGLAPRLSARGALAKLTAVQMIDVHLPATDGREIVLTRTTEPEPELPLLLDRMNLTPARSPEARRAGTTLAACWRRNDFPVFFGKPADVGFGTMSKHCHGCTTELDHSPRDDNRRLPGDDEAARGRRPTTRSAAIARHALVSLTNALATFEPQSTGPPYKSVQIRTGGHPVRGRARMTLILSTVIRSDNGTRACLQLRRMAAQAS
jgi:hypothetical protein